MTYVYYTYTCVGMCTRGTAPSKLQGFWGVPSCPVPLARLNSPRIRCWHRGWLRWCSDWSNALPLWAFRAWWSHRVTLRPKAVVIWWWFQGLDLRANLLPSPAMAYFYQKNNLKVVRAYYHPHTSLSLSLFSPSLISLFLFVAILGIQQRLKACHTHTRIQYI